MLIFIVPLQSKAASKDWRHISKMAERTLRSICAQTNGDFRVVMVCNERPDMDFTHPALTIIEENFPIPGANKEERMEDKSRKIMRAYVHARQWAPFYSMLTDADDCISRRLSDFVAKNAGVPGWYFEYGYFHDQGSPWLLRKKHFHRWCGTSHIMRVEKDYLPEDVTANESDYWLLSLPHPKIVDFMRERGTPLAPLPFPGTIYNTATGENYTGTIVKNWKSKKMFIEKMLNTRPVTAAVRKEFGLYNLEP